VNRENELKQNKTLPKPIRYGVLTQMNRENGLKQNKTQPKPIRYGVLIPTSLLIDTQFNDNMNIPKEATIYPIEK